MYNNLTFNKHFMILHIKKIVTELEEKIYLQVTESTLLIESILDSEIHTFGKYKSHHVL